VGADCGGSDCVGAGVPWVGDCWAAGVVPTLCWAKALSAPACVGAMAYAPESTSATVVTLITNLRNRIVVSSPLTICDWKAGGPAHPGARLKLGNLSFISFDHLHRIKAGGRRRCLRNRHLLHLRFWLLGRLLRRHAVQRRIPEDR